MDSSSSTSSSHHPNKRQRRSAGHSVTDFDTADELREALRLVDSPPSAMSHWKLAVPDPDAEPQTIDSELQRLLTLKSYLFLRGDEETKRALDALTTQACDYFRVPTSLITLIDLGRQLVCASTGSTLTETPRQVAFCSHTILSRHGVCVVNDTHKDQRFRNNTLVVNAPHLRFYAGAPLISPEGYTLGAFCVEGTQPRTEFTSKETLKLQQFAAQAMQLLVQRRKALQQTNDLPRMQKNLRRHAGIATNLGGVLYNNGECVTAMKLFQESVQTLMYVEEEGNVLPSTERQQQVAEIQTCIEGATDHKERREMLDRAVALFPKGGGVYRPETEPICRNCTVDGIPGLLSPTSKIKGSYQRTYANLFFGEAFKISIPKEQGNVLPPEERQFIIPLEECSKATLFNMGLIHYHWGSPDSAMQFFDLAASLSQQPLAFDPIVLGCLNNMAQIHLQYGRPNDAMELLSDALARGNAALAAMYDEKPKIDDVRRSRRLRRKLARTVMNMGHVHFFNCEYDKALTTCRDAIRLLHTNMEDMEVAAVWYNVAVLYHHKKNLLEALKYVDMFLERAQTILGPQHLQVSDGLHRKGLILFEMGQLYECTKPLNESLAIRCHIYQHSHIVVAESLCVIGKVLMEREEYDFAIDALKQGIAIHRQCIRSVDYLSFDAMQALLDLGRALHVEKRLEEALQIYLEVAALTKSFFGDRHRFVARIENIIGNIRLEGGEIGGATQDFAEAMKIHVENQMPVELQVVKDRLHRVDVVSTRQAASA